MLTITLPGQLEPAMRQAATRQTATIQRIEQELHQLGSDIHPLAAKHAAAISTIEAAGGIVDLTTLDVEWPT